MSTPAFHACLNATAAVLLVLGWLAITGRGPFGGRRREGLHKACMLAAVTVSAVFLVSYVRYHMTVGHVAFWGTGWIHVLYLIVLVPHMILAAVMVPPILILVVLALRGRLTAHKRLARITLPVWLYVSVSGVLVYLMLYRMGPG